MTIGNNNALWLLFAIPAILVPAYAWCFYKKARLLKVLASSPMLKKKIFSDAIRDQDFDEKYFFFPGTIFKFIVKLLCVLSDILLRQGSSK